MNLLVKTFAQQDDLKKATVQLKAQAAAMAPHKVSLSNETRKNLRVVGTSRLGLVEIVSRLATQYDDKLAKDEKALDLSERVNYLHALKDYKLAVKNLHELLDDTEKALGNDIMAYVDKFSNSLRSARKFDGDLDDAIKDLDDYNARFGAIMEEEDAENEADDTNSDTESK